MNGNATLVTKIPVLFCKFVVRTLDSLPMMKLSDKESPMSYSISFNKLLEQYDVMAKSEDKVIAEKAKRILKAQEPYPFLRDGFTDPSLLEKHSDIIKIILEDCFSDVLSDNEIKVASVPFENLVFNSSRRFQKIMDEAGEGFSLEIRNLPKHTQYLIASTVLLNFHYRLDFNFKRPLFFDIPDANGVIRHYRILYNADFMEMIPKENAKKLSQEDIDELLANFHDLELWKKKIPPNSFQAKGFVICTLVDVTSETAISEIKSELISNRNTIEDEHVIDMNRVFRSFFNMPDINIGYILYNEEEGIFEKVGADQKMKSYLLRDHNSIICSESLCGVSRKNIMEDSKYYAITNVDKFVEMTKGEVPLYVNLQKQGIKSAILAPITGNNGKLLGIMEVVSPHINKLNSINAQKLDDVMPFIVATVQRTLLDEENLIDAIIQHECTSVHPSVHWKFRKEAKSFMFEQYEGRQPSFSEMVFDEVYPLYGQVDIKDSSKLRNIGIQRDLNIQLTDVANVLQKVWDTTKLPIYEELLYRVFNHLNEIKEVLHTSSEQTIFDFIKEEIHPVFDYLKNNTEFKELIEDYETHIDDATGVYYDHRRNYDESVTRINKKMASIIDKKQLEAQKMYPHYFERYKTDGVEHNMFIGNSISKDIDFNVLFLNNLRLWQLQVMCQMENAHYNLKQKLSVPLDVASLILVYSTPLSIRFRMDEKRFDVDGTYNARYEVIKKRIDKSYIKGTNERLTQKGKLSIVYSQKKDELEYLRYIRFLMAKGNFTQNIEILELDGLQGVTGLKAIRVEILYQKDKEPEKTYTYEDLMKALEE